MKPATSKLSVGMKYSLFISNIYKVCVYFIYYVNS